MKKKIYLYWFKYPYGEGNFGDELNPYIISSLSPTPVQYVNVLYIIDRSPVLVLKILTSAFIHNKIGISDLFRYLKFNFIKKPKILFSIGSVLGSLKMKGALVWGSGIIQSEDYPVNAEFFAVRGPYTYERLLELGYQPAKVFGDPAILLPLLYKPSKNSKKFKVGIVPHYIHYEKLKNVFGENTLVINLLDNIEKIIDEIASCEIILSTSLHGIIVSHAYGIPALWTLFPNTEEIKLVGDNIKFKDYFSSVGLIEYDPIEIDSLVDLDLIRNKMTRKLLPQKEAILKIQKDLLKSAPFPLRNRFTEFFK